MNKLDGKDIKEGDNLSVSCDATPGNPKSMTVYWTKVDDPGFRQNGIFLQLPYIHRNSSGTYKCTAENRYNNKENGTDNQTMLVNVLCKYMTYSIKYAINEYYNDVKMREKKEIIYIYIRV